jgi:hypothetical protein
VSSVDLLGGFGTDGRSAPPNNEMKLTKPRMTRMGVALQLISGCSQVNDATFRS